MQESEKNRAKELELRQRNFCIGVIGSMASGKTTLIGILAARWGDVDLIRERPEENPFLRDYYMSDPKKWAFHSQVWYGNDKISLMTKPRNCYLTLVDPTLEMDKIYEYTNYLLGNITKEEHKLYLDLCDTLCEVKKYKKPDVIVSTNAPVDILIEHCKKRGRDYESKVDPDYLKILVRNVDQWVKENENKFNIINVDSSRWNFVDMELDQNLVVKDIERQVKALWYKKYDKLGVENMQDLPFFLRWPGFSPDSLPFQGLRKIP